MNEKELRRLIAKEARKVITEGKKNSYSLNFLLEDDQSGKEKESPKKLDISKGPTTALAFLNGPGSDPRVRALLNSGRRDGDPADEAAGISEGSSTLGNLIPTQVEIELTKSIAFPLSKFDFLKKMIGGGVQRVGPPGNDMIVTSGNLIIDGHHRWSSLFSVAGPEGQIASIDIGLAEKDAPSVLAIVQTAIATTLTSGEPVPKAKAGGMNILGKGKDELVQLITSAAGKGGEAGEILSDKFVQSCIDDPEVNSHFGLEGINEIEPARERIIEKVADNLSMMNQPAEGAPPRVDMPQLDQAKGGVAGALDKLKAGKVNYKAPFKVISKDDDEEKTQKESSKIKGDLVLERWQKIAGLVK
jgi:hypothetical protein